MTTSSASSASSTSPTTPADMATTSALGISQPPAARPQPTVLTRRARPGNLQTSISLNSQLMTITPSAFSTNSTSSMSVASSIQCSPVLSPDVVPGLTQSSSVQGSPEPMRGRDIEQFPPPAFQLPESVLAHSGLSRKASNGSLGQPLLGPGPGAGPGALHDAMSNKGLFRRLSNKATNTFRSRRQSSTHGSNRGASIGPGLARPRQRSNSDLTNPFTDSDDEPIVDLDDRISFLSITGEASCREVSPTSAPASIAGGHTSSGPVSVVAGPVIPLELLQGTRVVKCSKRGGRKHLTLILDPEDAKLKWDKNRTSKCIYIDDIKEIRTVEDIRQYRLDFGLAKEVEPNFFSILYSVPDKSKTKMMHLIAENSQVVEMWVSTLYAISMHRQDLMSSLMAFNDKAIRSYWQKEVVKQLKSSSDAEENIDFAGVERVCRSLHIHVAPETLKEKFSEALGTSPGDSESSVKAGRLNFSQFQEFVRLMKKREDIRPIYRERTSDIENGMTLAEFLSFLSEIQNEDVDAERAHWESVFARFSKRGKAKDSQGPDDPPRMNELGLAGFLTSTYNVPIASCPSEYSLDRPVNEYYISSSHNTYLLGRQVVGLSSVEGYISALMRGCRCVEVDCWDGNDGWPVVSHGWTMTTNISFREVMSVINKYAFVKSEFPLWISLEVHCCQDQQRKMVAIMKETFGSKLVTEPLEGLASDKLPSPSQLKNRILIKAKKPGHEESPEKDKAASGKTEKTGRRRGNSLNSPYSKPVFDSSPVPAQPLQQHSPRLAATHPTMRRIGKPPSRVNTITEGRPYDAPSSGPSDCDSGSERDSSSSGGVGGNHSSTTSKIGKELGDLAVYCAGIKFQGFDHADCKMFNHIFSFPEGTFQRNSRPGDAKRALYRHNMRHMMRVYPHKGRVYSSNFDPLLMWRRGVQMAALNWQTWDLGMQLNQAMFDGGTDQSGYVLKPKEFREIQHFPYLPEHMVGGKRPRKNVSFTIDVISAQQLMRPHNFRERQTLDPYVEVEVFLADDKRNANRDFSDAGPSRSKRKTPAVAQNGFNPGFESKFNFEFQTKYPDLIFVRFNVRLSEGGSQSDRNTILASFTAKLSNLKQGYRTLPLLDANGDRYLFSTLFCRIKVDPATDVFVDYTEEESVSKLRSIGRTVFNRGTNSPKSSVDSGAQA
ncbi:phosphoinositide-specific phospholipase C [Magnaporthiopsis poae ATCC 64411]|uniref:Phosphoinositide phospholipase C n=1 Tax=Magnaporthiopsis poae (strain ATCC 64411 / 73-15) TaxID=644358 RepID=A0A0C4DV60_MAGP6|nr:phosphoinositide-specific phospholipase C [Magnaporthiopsis poae ATCC 64411]